MYPHAATRIRQSDYEAADYIFCMDDENYYSLLRQLDNHKNIIYRINLVIVNIILKRYLMFLNTNLYSAPVPLR